MARLPKVSKESLPPEKRYLLDTLAAGDENDEDEDPGHNLSGSTLNVYSVMANNPPLLEGFWTYRDEILEHGGLTTIEREYIILALARHVDAAYEWQQHVRVSLGAGVTQKEIIAISDHDLDALDPKYATLVEYVAACIDGSVDDQIHAALAQYYDDSTIIGILSLAGLYLSLARLLQALDIKTEVEFVGWRLENL